jgi:hypothetical protein
MNKKCIFAIVVMVCTLLLGGCCMSHEWKDATCTEPKTCQKCGETEGTSLGHDWKAATCLEAKTCKRCGATEGSALGHDWKEATCEDPKTCKVCGATEGTALGHDWKDATCEVPKTCKNCGATEGTLAEHVWEAATCEKPKTCKVCGATEGSVADHIWEEATCEKAKTCKVCGKTEGTPAEHTWEAATCEEAKTCKICGKTEGEPIGHDWEEATCEKAKTCKVCGATEGEPLPHDWQDATCDKAKTCKICGTTEGEPLGHDWANATLKAPKTCNRCGVTEGKKVSVKKIEADKLAIDKAEGIEWDGVYFFPDSFVCTKWFVNENGDYPDIRGFYVLIFTDYSGNTLKEELVAVLSDVAALGSRPEVRTTNVGIQFTLIWLDPKTNNYKTNILIYDPKGNKTADFVTEIGPERIVHTIDNDYEIVDSRYMAETEYFSGDLVCWLDMKKMEFVDKDKVKVKSSNMPQYDTTKYSWCEKIDIDGFKGYYVANADRTKWGYTDEKFNVIALYDDASIFTPEGFAFAKNSNGKYDIIDRDFNVVAKDYAKGESAYVLFGKYLVLVQDGKKVFYIVK